MERGSFRVSSGAFHNHTPNQRKLRTGAVLNGKPARSMLDFLDIAERNVKAGG